MQFAATMPSNTRAIIFCTRTMQKSLNQKELEITVFYKYFYKYFIKYETHINY